METLPKNFLEKDWVNLLEEAKDIGLTVEEVKQFLIETSARGSG